MRIYRRNIQPEIIEEYLGKEIEESDLERNKNPTVDENLFCRACEKKFNPIETQFMQQIIPILEKGNYQKDYLKLDAQGYSLLFAFLMINLLRCSLSSQLNGSLPNEIIDSFKNWLRVNHSEPINELEDSLSKLDCFHRVKFACFYLQIDNGKRKAGFVQVDSLKSPFMLLLNQLLIIAFIDFPVKYSLNPILKGAITKSQILKMIKNQPFFTYIKRLNSQKQNLIVEKNLKIQRNELDSYLKFVSEKLYYNRFGQNPGKEYLIVMKKHLGMYMSQGHHISQELIAFSIDQALKLTDAYRDKFGFLPK